MKVDVLVAHPGKHHVFHLVAGCVKSGAKVAFIAPFYACGLGKIIACMPGKIGSKAKGYVHSGIPLSVVMSPLKWQLSMLKAYYANDHLFADKFDRFVAQAIKREEYQAKVVITLQDYMPETVHAAKERGYIIWSDQISNQSAEANDRILHHRHQLGLSTSWYHSECRNNEIIESANIVTLPSSYCFDGIRERVLTRTKVATIPYGADAELFSVPRCDAPGEVLILARAPSIRKGGHLLLSSLHQCGEQLMAACAPKKIKVVILGNLESDLLAVLDNIILPAGLSVEHVSVPHVLVPRFYQRASLFVMPALSESMSMACVEAMHAGLPLIITKYCGIDGFVSGEMGYEVADTIEALAAALEEAFKNQNLWQWWGDNCRRLAQQLTWDVYEERIAKLTQEILS